jgi:hypothetical protein
MKRIIPESTPRLMVSRNPISVKYLKVGIRQFARQHADECDIHNPPTPAPVNQG